MSISAIILLFVYFANISAKIQWILILLTNFYPSLPQLLHTHVALGRLTCGRPNSHSAVVTAWTYQDTCCCLPSLCLSCCLDTDQGTSLLPGTTRWVSTNSFSSSSTQAAIFWHKESNSAAVSCAWKITQVLPIRRLLPSSSCVKLCSYLVLRLRVKCELIFGVCYYVIMTRWCDERWHKQLEYIFLFRPNIKLQEMEQDNWQ